MARETAGAPASGALADLTLSGGAHWLHLDRQDTAVIDWLRHDAGLAELVGEALLADETRPRCQRDGDGVLLILRGVNLNPGAKPEDMVSLRLWVSGERIVSCRLRPLRAVQAIKEELEAGGGPARPGAFLTALADGLTERMEPVIQAMEDQLASAETVEAGSALSAARIALRTLRKRVTILRRYIGPQRDALAKLASEDLAWLTGEDRAALRETANDVTRLVEALNALWERAAALQEEYAAAIAEQTNERLYLLSIVAGVFLPLSFVTGLLGMNVAGMPGMETDWAFAAVCGLLVLCAGVELWLFRRLRWL